MNATAVKSEGRIGEETEKLGDLLPKVIDEMVMQVFSLHERAEEKVQLLKYESMQSLTESVYAEES